MSMTFAIGSKGVAMTANASSRTDNGPRPVVPATTRNAVQTIPTEANAIRLAAWDRLWARLLALLHHDPVRPRVVAAVRIAGMIQI
jgi:hypothetical protein